jgi:glycosyltransferase involved in cell wall biosynthesis
MPRVSFVVPCYKHGHFLAACVESILGQSFDDLEVIVMDDCSPDETPEVARSLRDPRVVYVRNETNLGHLQNYNKGLRLARGEFLWLINVDDKLRQPYVVERYVQFMDRHPRASFVFCPAVPLRGDVELEPAYGIHGSEDRLFDGRELLERLVYWNSIWVPSVMARRQAYERAGLFPLDLPFSGDWYLWCHFAVHGDVGYLAEPMVHYRLHDANMTHGYVDRTALVIAQEAEVRWRVKRLAEQAGLKRVARICRKAIASTYFERARRRDDLASLRPQLRQHYEDSLRQHCATALERAQMRALLALSWLKAS